MESEHQAIVIADLGYGDAGKGSIVDALARSTGARTVVRYNGGAQAAHNVITPDGRHHTFAQFGSSSFLADAQTYLSRFMITHPLAMLAEERHLRSLGVNDAFTRMFIDRQALVTTPFQQAANRIKEILRGGARHGSCGLGVGETMADWLAHGSRTLFIGDLTNQNLVMKKLGYLRDSKWAEIETSLKNAPNLPGLSEEVHIFHDPNLIKATAEVMSYFSRLVNLVDNTYLKQITNQPGVTIFEGAQGVLLDEWYGFFPYNTWSTLTFKNAETLLAENKFNGQLIKLGLIRGYATRHGAGPFVSEDANLSATLQDHHNINNPWQRQFRVGPLDLVALRYAVRVSGGADGLVVTNLDRLGEISDWRICEGYTSKAADLEAFFTLHSGDVQDIRIPDDPTDLVRQEQLTTQLMNMQPVYKHFQKDEPAFLEHISQSLGLPVVMTSSGPRAQDKYFAPECILAKEILTEV